jgi:DNA adenine methylase
VKSPVPYFGSKQTLAPWIVSLLPRHEHYVEPFCGGLSVLMAKRPTKLETVNDLNRDLMTFWRVLRDRPVELSRACMLTPHSRAEYELAQEPAIDDLEAARRVWSQLVQGRTGQFRRSGWRLAINPEGSARPISNDFAAWCNRLAPAAERLKKVSLECLPALDVIAKYGGHPSVLLYVDPPYLGSTRESTGRYQLDMKDEDGHRQLATALEDCSATVVLSGYHSPLYDELYAGWHRYEKATTTGNATTDKGRTEVLWSNRELAAQGDLFGGAA